MAAHPTESITGYKTFLDDDTGDFDDGVPYVVQLSSDGLTVVPLATLGLQIGVFAGKISTTAGGDNLRNNVRLLNSGGTALMKTGGAITQVAGGAPVSVESGGTIVTGETARVGRLLGATAASGDIVEVQLDEPSVGVVSHAVTCATSATTFAIPASMPPWGGYLLVTGDTGNTIATITGGVEGQIITMKFADALVTISDVGTATADSVDCVSTTDLTGAVDTTFQMVYSGVKWFEISRSVN